MLSRMRSRVTPIVAALVLLGSLAGAAPSQALRVGLADQQASSFADPLLTALPVRDARLTVAWDALEYRWQRQEIDEWMRTTRAAGMRAVITFGRSRTRKYSLPATGRYRNAAHRFMRRYRDVREYSPWNEPNIALRPENSDPRRIAAYYRALRGLCPNCRVLGADVVDNSSLGTWMSSYLAVFPRAGRPRLWGLHNYVDVNTTSRWGTRTMLRLAPGEIWFTETGAVISRQKPSGGRPDRRKLIRTGAARAAASTKRVFALARMSPRITRVYIYHWRAGGRKASWDSGLLSEAGTPRASFDVFARQARLAAGLPAQPPE